MATSIGLDFRSFSQACRQAAKELGTRVKKVSEDPEVKTAIYTQIYEEPIIHYPIYTGALMDSPNPEKQGEHDMYYHTNVAYGSIDDSGIHWDPYSIDTKKDGATTSYSEEHYVQKLVSDQKFDPWHDINANWDRIAEIVKEHLVEGYERDG